MKASTWLQYRRSVQFLVLITSYRSQFHLNRDNNDIMSRTQVTGEKLKALHDITEHFVSYKYIYYTSYYKHVKAFTVAQYTKGEFSYLLYIRVLAHNLYVEHFVVLALNYLKHTKQVEYLAPPCGQKGGWHFPALCTNSSTARCYIHSSVPTG